MGETLRNLLNKHGCNLTELYLLNKHACITELVGVEQPYVTILVEQAWVQPYVGATILTC